MSAAAQPGRSPESLRGAHTSNGVPRVALRWPEEVAEALGVSADTLQRHGVIAGVRVWRLGSIRLVAVDELRRLVEDNAVAVPGGDHATG